MALRRNRCYLKKMDMNHVSDMAKVNLKLEMEIMKQNTGKCIKRNILTQYRLLKNFFKIKFANKV